MAKETSSDSHTPGNARYQDTSVTLALFEKRPGNKREPLTPALLFQEFGVDYVGDVPTVPLLVKIASEEKGYGLFALNAITSGTEIGIYTGKLRKIDLLIPQINPYCLLYPTRSGIRRQIIDGFRYGSLMRFLNHSDEPNVGVSWVKNGPYIPHIITIRDVSPGEELTISYGNNFKF